MKAIRFPLTTVPLLLLGLCILSYGLMAGQMGFYQDDWYQVWTARQFGPSAFIPYYSWERPFIAYIYMLTTPIVGDVPLNWQIFAILCRWLLAVCAWWGLLLSFPRQQRQVTWIACLFAVYPGFRQQFVSVIYSHYLLLFAIHVLSLCLLLVAMRMFNSGKRLIFLLLTIFSVSLAAFSLFSAEYSFGIEFLRPMLLWAGLGLSMPLFSRQKIRKAFLFWLPYLATTAAFLYWRVFVFKFPTRYKPITSALLENPVHVVSQLGRTILQDLFEVSVYAWAQTFNLIRSIDTTSLSTLAASVLALISAGVVYIYFSRLNGQLTFSDNHGLSNETRPGTWAHYAILTGVVALLGAGIPFWFVGLRPIDIEEFNRFTISFMFAACILVVGLIDLIIHTRRQKIVILSVLVGLAVGQNLKDANIYRLIHQEETTFFRQLSWRVPALEPGTAVLTNKFPTNYASDTTLSTPLNWIYDQAPPGPRPLQYILLFLDERRIGRQIPAFEKERPISYNLRVAQFTGSTSMALVVYYKPNACLQVLDPVRGRDDPRLSQEMSGAVPLSNLSMIDVDTSDTAGLPPEVFGPAPKPDWCYYYERGDLARQKGDWPQVIEAYRDAEIEGFTAKNDLEYLPLIEGLAHTGEWEKATRLTQKVQRSTPNALPVLCRIWQDLQQVYISDANTWLIARNMKDDLDCIEPANE